MASEWPPPQASLCGHFTSKASTEASYAMSSVAVQAPGLVMGRVSDPAYNRANPASHEVEHTALGYTQMVHVRAPNMPFYAF